jgi:hypothetical protein
MTQQEHLKRIRARCVELLEIAEKRTPRKWDACGKGDYYPIGGSKGPIMACILGDDMMEKVAEAYEDKNAAFIASCAGPAEAGWRATIKTVEMILVIIQFHTTRPTGETQLAELETAADIAESIIAAWPIELLNP